MKTIIQKLKRIIGRCECNKCWGRANADIRCGDHEMQVCIEHLFEILERPKIAK